MGVICVGGLQHRALVCCFHGTNRLNTDGGQNNWQWFQSKQPPSALTFVLVYS